ncbi:MAG: sugar ABC transporter permease, partial [Alphaproteobacteria bacterium]|nr:sugar ABC transporter permease [Alphaproteobacteria bacterium]
MASGMDKSAEPAMAQESAFQRFLRATELDTRLLGMVGALVLIWIGFHLAGIWRTGNGIFLSPRNLWILLVQTSSIAVMTTGMVMIIVMRHIDLSVGSLLGVIAVIMGYAQVYVLGPWLGVGHPAIWILTVLIGLGAGALLGAFHGYLIAYAGIPSFIVTLGGLIVWRGAAWAGPGYGRPRC